MTSKFTFQPFYFLPILLLLAFPFSMKAAAIRQIHATAQHCFTEKKEVKQKRFVYKLFRSKLINVEKKKIDKLAWVVFIGGLLSFLLVFPVKFFLGFAILGFATLITSIFAFHRIKREGTSGRWLVILGVLLVLVPGALFGLVFAALNKL